MKQKSELMGLREYALGFPGAYEEFPWGDRVVKVKGKIFVFLGETAGGIGIAVKLPRSHQAALALPFTSPTGYGLGKAGWIDARFQPGEKPPLPLLREWIEESYRTIAPKGLIAELDGQSTTITPRKAPTRKDVPSKRGAARRKTSSRKG